MWGMGRMGRMGRMGDMMRYGAILQVEKRPTLSNLDLNMILDSLNKGTNYTC